jgi:hypothetical protein
MKRLTMALVLALMLAIAGTAQAQSPVGDAYGGNGVLDDVERVPPPSGPSAGEETDGQVPTGPTETVTRESGAPSAGSPLPFTGLDVGLLTLGGIAMLGVGVGLRRLSRATG